MKVPKAQKLPSGSWTVRVVSNGRRVSITKPTRKEAEAEAAAIKAGAKKIANMSTMTLGEAADRYIDDREGVCSPSTIWGYRQIRHNRFPTLMLRQVSSITQEQCQKAIREERKSVSAKTIKNSWGFISSVISEATGQRITVTLPQQIPKETPYLTAEQIPVFVDAIHGTSVEIPALLGLSSLRQSEMLALRWKDIDLNKKVLYVNGATVMSESKQRVRKPETKNRTSRRTVSLIPPLLDALQAADPDGELVVKMAPNSIRNHINKICAREGLPKIGIHGLRHSFASLCYRLQVPELVVQQLGGWSDSSTVHKIYTHIGQQEMVQTSNQISDFYEKNGNENGNEI